MKKKSKNLMKVCDLKKSPLLLSGFIFCVCVTTRSVLCLCVFCVCVWFLRMRDLSDCLYVGVYVYVLCVYLCLCISSFVPMSLYLKYDFFVKLFMVYSYYIILLFILILIVFFNTSMPY